MILLASHVLRLGRDVREVPVLSPPEHRRPCVDAQAGRTRPLLAGVPALTILGMWRSILFCGLAAWWLSVMSAEPIVSAHAKAAALPPRINVAFGRTDAVPPLQLAELPGVAGATASDHELEEPAPPVASPELRASCNGAVRARSCARPRAEPLLPRHRRPP